MYRLASGKQPKKIKLSQEDLNLFNLVSSLEEALRGFKKHKIVLSSVHEDALKKFCPDLRLIRKGKDIEISTIELRKAILLNHENLIAEDEFKEHIACAKFDDDFSTYSFEVSNISTEKRIRLQLLEFGYNGSITSQEENIRTGQIDSWYFRNLGDQNIQQKNNISRFIGGMVGLCSGISLGIGIPISLVAAGTIGATTALIIWPIAIASAVAIGIGIGTIIDKVEFKKFKENYIKLQLDDAIVKEINEIKLKRMPINIEPSAPPLEQQEYLGNYPEIHTVKNIYSDVKLLPKNNSEAQKSFQQSLDHSNTTKHSSINKK
ncbi:MAG: hypothetical protein ACK4OM_00250 [Alphaproteobacteria bacterium]